MSDFNTVKITNQLSCPVDIYDQFDPSTPAQPDQPFTYTKLATIAAGATGEVGTIRKVALLVAMVTGAFSEMADRYYYQFPVKLMSGTKPTFGNPPPLAYTVTPDDRSAAILSLQFHRFVMANPNSGLTKNFNNALKAGFDAVTAFFKATSNFQACSMGTWHMVVTWLNNFTSAWQGPYYLYEAPPSPLPADYVPKLVATVDIQSSATQNSAVLTMCTADAEGNPQFSTPLEQTTLVMAGGATMQDATPGTETSITLTPVWMNVIQTPIVDGTPTPKYLIGSGLQGNVGPVNVVSSQTARQLPGKPPKSDSENTTFDKLFNKAVEIIGALAGLVAIYEFAAKKFGKGEAAKETAKSEATDAADLAKRESAIDQSIQTEVTDPASGVPALEAAAEANPSRVSDGYSATAAEMQADTMARTITDKVGAVEAEVDTALENGDTPSQAFEDAWTDMQTKAQTAMEKIGEGDLTSWKGDFDQSLTGLDTAVKTTDAEFADSVQDLQTSYKEAAERSTALNEAAEEHAKETEDPEDDSGYDEDDDNDPPETDDIPVAEEL